MPRSARVLASGGADGKAATWRLTSSERSSALTVAAESSMTLAASEFREHGGVATGFDG